MKIIDYDIIYLSYDEPNAEKNYADLLSKVPWAKRVHGVEGSDAAHKACANLSETSRFITVDGDNIIKPEFLNQVLNFDEHADLEHSVISWCGRNVINGLMYGNGGISSWTKTFVNNMRTHEASEGADETDVEFCFDDLYWPMYNCYSTTYPGGSAKHAWRAGFREGVKMCLDRGRKPSTGEFKDKVHSRNLDHLTIWQNIGADTEHGLWAIAGARLGTYKTMLTEWDHTEVQWFDNLENMWEEIKHLSPGEIVSLYNNALHTQLDLPMNVLAPDQSKFFKHHYRSNWNNQTIMTREIDVIRSQEGW